MEKMTWHAYLWTHNSRQSWIRIEIALSLKVIFYGDLFLSPLSIHSLLFQLRTSSFNTRGNQSTSPKPCSHHCLTQFCFNQVSFAIISYFVSYLLCLSAPLISPSFTRNCFHHHDFALISFCVYLRMCVLQLFRSDFNRKPF